MEPGAGLIPFGYSHEPWRALLAEMQDGDELCEFRSPPETWNQLAGRAGVVLLRGGKVVGGMVTTLS